MRSWLSQVTPGGRTEVEKEYLDGSKLYNYVP